MNKPKFIFKLFLFLLVFSAANVFAQSDIKQPQNETTYEVVLQVLVASNEPGAKAPVPASLANSIQKLKTLYAFSDYRVSATFLQRTSKTIEYKSVLNDLIPNVDRTMLIFLEWELRNLRKMPNSPSLQFDTFRFGARVPIVTTIKDDAGKGSTQIAYDSIGITTSRVSVNENEPTIIGSLATSKSDQLMFLILTVTPVG